MRGEGHLCEYAFGLRDPQTCNDVRSARNGSVIPVCYVIVFVAAEYAARTVAGVCRGLGFAFNTSAPVDEMQCPRECDAVITFRNIRPQLPVHCAAESAAAVVPVGKAAAVVLCKKMLAALVMFSKLWPASY